jgi:3-dehydroquinate synthase
MPLNDHSYDILLDHKAILQLPIEIKRLYHGDKIFVVTDETVYHLYSSMIKQLLTAFNVNFIVVAPGEQAKSIAIYETVIDALIDQGMKRTDLLIALGGGVIGDLAGFVASTIYRGVPYIQIPTTLLAQVDSSIGGKTAINSHKGKNMIGTLISST